MNDVYTAKAGFSIHRHDKLCNSDATLTIEECSNAQVVINPSAGPVKQEMNKDSPNGCYRYEGAWYFNSQAKGTLDGVSEPICKARSGEIMRMCC